MHNTPLNQITFVRKTHFNVPFAMLQKNKKKYHLFAHRWWVSEYWSAIKCISYAYNFSVPEKCQYNTCYYTISHNPLCIPIKKYTYLYMLNKNCYIQSNYSFI